MPIQNATVTLKPLQGGNEFELRSIQTVDWGVSRPANPSGHIGMRGFNINTINISRIKSLQDGTEAEREDETIKLTSGMDKKGYCSGEITIALPDDEANNVLTLRWDHGFISGLTCSIDEYGITENLEITVTDLMVDDYEFKRVAA